MKGNNFTYTLPDNDTYYFAVTAFDNGYYESEISDIVKVSASLGTIDADLKPVKFIVSGDWLKVESENTVVSVSIYALSGTQVAYSGSSEVNVARLNRGAYIVVAVFGRWKSYQI